QTQTMRRLADALLLGSLIGLVFLPTLDHLGWLERGVVGVGMLMVYIVARFWGAVLPNLAELSIEADDRAGMRTAVLYLSNILGWAAGSVLTGFVLMDRFGLITIASMLAIADVACALVPMLALAAPRREKLRHFCMAAIIAVAAVGVVPQLSAG